MPKSEHQLIQETLQEAKDFDAALLAGNPPIRDQNDGQLEREFFELFGREVNPPVREPITLSDGQVVDVSPNLQETSQFTTIPEIPLNNLEQAPAEIPTNGSFADGIGGLPTGIGSFADTPTKKVASTQNNITAKDISTVNRLREKQSTLGITLSEKEQNVLSSFDAFYSDLSRTAEREANAKTALVSDEFVQTNLGKITNLAVAAKSGLGDIARTFISAPFRQSRINSEFGITDIHKEVYESATEKNRQKELLNNQLDILIKTPESPERDIAVTNLLAKLEQQRLTEDEDYIFREESTRNSPENIYQTDTIAQRIYKAQQLTELIDIIELQAEESASKINSTFTDVADRKLKKATDEAVTHFKEGDNLAGVSSFLNGVAVLATEDTFAAAQVFTKSLPYMAAMAFAGLVTVPATAIEIQDNAVESHKAEYGELPTADERALIGILSLTSAGLDKIGASTTKNAAAITNSLVKSSRVLNQKIPSALIQGIKVTGAPLGAVAVEGATEGIQNVLEQTAGSIRDPEIDVSQALQDTAHGAIGGAIFSSPGVAKQAVTSTGKPLAKATKTAVNKASTKIQEVGSKLEEAAIKNTEELIKEKSKSDPTTVVKRIISDGFDGLTPKKRTERLTTLITLNDELRPVETREGNEVKLETEYEETIKNLIEGHRDLLREEATGKRLQEHIKDTGENSESINEVASAVTQGTDLPLKTLDNISGSTLFTKATDKSQTVIKKAIKYKKSLAKVSDEIKFGDVTKGTKGLVTHLDNVVKAITVNDTASAQKSIDELTTWKVNQQSKLAAYNKAKVSFDPKSNQPVEFTYKGETLSYHPVKTKKLLNIINNELVAISNTLDQAKSLIQANTTTAPLTTEAKPDVVKEAVKKVTVQEKIEEPLTTDIKLANEKIKALKVLAGNSGKLSTELVKRVTTLTRLLGTVETRNESQLVRLNNELVSIFKAIRANVKPKVKDTSTDITNTGDLTKNLLADSVTNKSLSIPIGKNPSKVGTAKGLKAKDIFKRKSVETKGFLNVIPNFFSTYSKDGFTKDMLSKVGAVSADETVITDSITKFHNAFGKDIESKISFLDKKNPIFPEFINEDGNTVLSSLDQNPLGYLVKEDAKGNRTIDENLIGLMSTTMYNWLATRASSTLINLDSDINSILGRDSSHTIEANERDVLQYVGSTQNVIAETLGKQVVKQLGLQVTDKVDGNMLDRLAHAIGLQMIATGIDRNYLESTKVDMSIFHNTNLLIDARNTSFIKLKGDVNNKPPGRVQNIINTFNKSSDFIDRVFGVESFERYPSIKIVTTTPKFLKGTTQKIPKKLKQAILRKQKVKWEVKVDMYNIATKISRDTLNRLAGFTEDLDSQHVTKRDSVNAVNADITRKLDNYFKSIDKLEEGIEQDIYFEYESFKNGRTTITSNMLNPAANTIHRHLIGADAWNITVPSLSDEGSDVIRQNFKLAVAQAFGFGIDKNTPEAAITKFDQIINEPIIQKGIEAVKAITLKGDVTPEREQALEAAIAYGGEKLHTLDGLVALAQYSPTESFSTNLGIEVDGVTNGIAIGLMQAPVEKNTDTLLQSVGIFLNDQLGINYPEWASNPTNLDLYQTLTSNWVKELNERISLSPKLTNNINNFNELIGTFVESTLIEDEVTNIVTKLGRDIAKNPMMLTGYGSAIKNSVNNLTPQFIEKIYSKLQKASTAQDVTGDTRNIINTINKITENNHFVDVNYSDPLNIVFTPEVVKELSDVINKTYGDALKIALETSFPEFFKFRNNINTMMNASFAVFNVKYKSELEKKSKAVGGRMLSTIEEQEIFDSLKEYQPLIKSALSEGLEDSLIVIDSLKKRGYSNRQANVQIGLKKTANLKSASLTGTVSHTDYAEPGARGLVFATQGQDAAIQAVSGFTHDFLDIFDAKMLAITDVDEATTSTNKAMWDITTTYSVMDSVHETFKRTMLLVGKNVEMRKEVLAVINKHKKPENFITVNEFNKNTLNLKKDIAAKRKAIKETSDTVVSQYAHGESSTYTANPTKSQIDFDEQIPELLDDWTEAIKKLEADLDKPSGSSITPIDFDNFNHRYDARLGADNTLAVFDDMATFGNKKDSVAHTNHLRNILTNVVNKVLRATDSIEFKVGDTNEVSHGAAKGEKVYINASTVNRLNNNNEMSLQEIQVHELLHTTLNYAIDNNFHTRKELIKLFRIVDKGIRDIYGKDGWKVFMHKDVNNNNIIQTNLADEELAAKERYDYIFNNTSTHNVPTLDPLTGKLNDKRSNDYLKEFISFGLTNETFIKVLSEIDTTTKRSTKDLSLKDTLLAWLDSALNWVSGKLFHTQNLSADKVLQNLVDQLAGITSKQRNGAIQFLINKRDINTVVAKKIYASIIEPLATWRIEQSRRPDTVIGKATTAIALIPVAYHNSEIRKHIREVLRRIGLVEENVIIKLIREVQGGKSNNLVWHTLLRQSKHLVDAARKRVSVDVQSYLRDSFQAGLPSVDESKAITRVMFKLDMSVLTPKYSISGLVKLLRNSTDLDTAIDSVKQELNVFGTNTNYYINQARGLGNFIALGKNQSKMQSLNAHNIANLITDTRSSKASIIGDVVVAEEIIDRLATLYGLVQTSNDNKNLVADVMERENSTNNQDNSITSILNMQTLFKEESLRDLFKGNKTQTIKGYIHETFNPRTDIKIGTHADEAELLKSGYIKQTELAPDSKDPNQSVRSLYVLKDAVGETYLKSIVSLTSKVARGTTMMDGYVSLGSLTPFQDAIDAKNAYITNSEVDINRQFNNTNVVNTSSTLVPILNEQGNVTEFRNIMSEAQRISLLERDDRFDAVMGNMFGSIKDKLNSKQVNRRVVELAYEDFQTGFASDPNAYVTISLNSTEKRYKELFSLVPEDMRRDMQDVWGKKEMVIRRELADLIFGYRKWSFTNLGRDSEFKSLQTVYKLLNTGMARHIEAVWQEVVSIAKTNIVIRTPAVLMDNFISNAILSLVKGVPVTYMVKNQALAIRALDSYQSDLKARNALQLRLDSTPNLTQDQITKLESRIAQMDDNLTTNPVSKMVDEGIFQAITEDLEDSRSPYNFRDKILSDLKLDKITNSENVLVRNATQQAFMTEETSIFKLLMKATQYSDFIARFALHKHNTEVKKMDVDESLRDVIETFVNYDIPTSKQLQYMNDMGIFMFSKFLFRIQKVIFTLLKDRPVSVGMALLTQQIFGDAPDVMDAMGVNLDGRVGFVLGPLDTATDINGLKHVGEVLGY